MTEGPHMSLANIRTDYRRGKLRRTDLNQDPIEQFHIWFAEACREQLIETTAMSLATAAKDGKPRVRTVLLKGLDERGFVFYTNQGSRKARQIAETAPVS